MADQLQLRTAIDHLRRRLAEEPDGRGGRLVTLPYYRSALAEIELEFIALCALQARLAVEPERLAAQATATVVSAQLDLAVSTLMMQAVGPASAVDGQTLRENGRHGRDHLAGLVESHLLRICERAAAEQSCTAVLAAALLGDLPSEAGA